MSQADLDRLRDDLETVKLAAGVDFPFGRDDVLGALLTAGCGVFLALWPLLGSFQYRWLLIVPFALLVVAMGWAYSRARRRRGPEPVRWREQRLWGITSIVGAPLLIAYVVWEQQIGVPQPYVGAAAIFFGGASLFIFVVFDRRRLSYAGWALPMMAFALAKPFLPGFAVGIAAGICLAIAGAAAAGILAWQLRGHGNDHATH